MNAFIVELENRAGMLAGLAETIAEKGINITGIAGASGTAQGAIAMITNDEAGTRIALDGSGVSYREVSLVSAGLEDRPGSLATAARLLAEAGVNIEAILPTGMDAGKITIAFAVDNVDAARQALGELTSIGA